MKTFVTSNAYVSAAHELIPGGAHTYAKGDDQYPEAMAPVIERGAGCRVWDIGGNEYVEFGSGLWSPASITSFAVGQSGLPYTRADEELVPCRSEPSW